MITRTFISYNCTVKVVDKTTAEVSDVSVLVPMASFNAKKPEKSISKMLKDNQVLVSVVSIDKLEDLRGITEEDFLAHSVAVTRPASQQKKTDGTVNA